MTLSHGVNLYSTFLFVFAGLTEIFWA